MTLVQIGSHLIWFKLPRQFYTTQIVLIFVKLFSKVLQIYKTKIYLMVGESTICFLTFDFCLPDLKSIKMLNVLKTVKYYKFCEAKNVRESHYFVLIFINFLLYIIFHIRTARNRTSFALNRV